MTTWTRRGGRYVVQKSLFLSTFRVENVHVEVGGGVKKGQNCVHVVIECPLTDKKAALYNFFAQKTKDLRLLL